MENAHDTVSTFSNGQYASDSPFQPSNRQSPYTTAPANTCTVGEAARYLMVSEATIREWIGRGRLKATWRDSDWLVAFPPEDVNPDAFTMAPSRVEQPRPPEQPVQTAEPDVRYDQLVRDMLNELLSLRKLVNLQSNDIARLEQRMRRIEQEVSGADVAPDPDQPDDTGRRRTFWQRS